jgi:hypothetical protein
MRRFFALDYRCSCNFVNTAGLKELIILHNFKPRCRTVLEMCKQRIKEEMILLVI